MTTQQRISIFKWGTILIIAVLLFMFWRGCKNEGKSKSTTDTISVVIDTIWMPSLTDTFYTPKEKEYVPYYKTDTLETTEYVKVKVDTAAILKDYLATRYYSDSVLVRFGKVVINDTVSKNKIVKRGVKTEINVPVIKETVTIARPPRNIAYLGFDAMGKVESPLYSVGASFGFKLKNDKYYGLRAAMSKDGNPIYGIELKIPIRLKK